MDKRPTTDRSEDSGNESRTICSVERACGACSFLAVPYETQLARKDARIAELFGGLQSSTCITAPILGMDEPFFYRNKVMSPFAPGRSVSKGRGRSKKGSPGKILTGMYARGTHRLVDTSTCVIEHPVAQRVFAAMKGIMSKYGIEPYNEDKGTGFIRAAVVRVAHVSDEVLVTIVTNGERFESSKSFCRQLVSKVPEITTVVQNINMRSTNVVLGDREQVLYGPGFILDKLCGLSFRISSRSFYQVNVEQAGRLYDAAIFLAGLGEESSGTLVDAYCGTGTIGLVAASRAPQMKIVGVDSVASSIHDARENARHNGIENAEFVACDAGAFLSGLAQSEESPACLIMDPPRAGSDATFLDAVLKVRPKTVSYISCNPVTQQRDVAYLRRGGYELTGIQPVDMFPHTDHIENICILKEG